MERFSDIKEVLEQATKLPHPTHVLQSKTMKNMLLNDKIDLVLLWQRLIDDIFLLFKGPKRECETFF